MKKIIFIVFFSLNLLNAHALKGFISEETSSNLTLQAYFYGNSPCKNCEVKLICEGKVLETSKTDNKGFASLKLPPSDAKIIIDGGLGHQKILEYSPKVDIKSTKKDPNERGFLFDAMKFILAILSIFILFFILYLFKKHEK